MNAQNFYLEGTFLVLLFLLYNYFVFEFSDQILDEPRLKRPLRLLVGLFNACIAVGLTLIPSSSSRTSYLVVMAILFVEFLLFYKDTLLRVLLITLSFTLHIMAMRAICTSILSILTGKTIFALVDNHFWLVVSMGITFLILDLMLFLILKFIPVKVIRIINQHSEQLIFMTIWLAVANLYFLFNAKVYKLNSAYDFIVQNQLAVSLALLFGIYIVLFFTLKTGELLNYKEQNSELLQAVENEQQFRDSVINDAMMVYEVNLTTDSLIQGLEEYQAVVEKLDHKYSALVLALAGKIIYPDDVETFVARALPEHLLAEYHQGKSETSAEYRRLKSDGGFLWARAVTNFYRDTATGDIKAFTYIKNIQEEKLLELELKEKAEKDSLTGLYNKGTTEKMISDYLAIQSDFPLKGSLFMIDVDNFKEVNDNLGHTFGDMVLCELADKLREIFRTQKEPKMKDHREDIIGRVGGDEFVVFMKNTSNTRTIQAKAQSICKAFRLKYTCNDGRQIAVSASVGIASYPQHGETLADILRSADIALYQAKRTGKNAFCVYAGEAFSGYEGKRKEIVQDRNLPQKSFRQNRIEYVFKVLYDAESTAPAVQSVLEVLASSLNFSRGYIFEIEDEGRVVSNTFEWCADGIEPQIHKLQKLPLSSVATAMQSFAKTGSFILGSLSELSAEERAVLEPQGIQSMLQFGIIENGQVLGFIGFDDCKIERSPTLTEIDEMATLCHILSTFILKQRHSEQAVRQSELFLALAERLDSLVYVMEPSTYRLLYANEKAKQCFKNKNATGCCYALLKSRATPCTDCPTPSLNETSPQLWRQEENGQITMACLLEWAKNEPACLLCCGPPSALGCSCPHDLSGAELS